ncbi:MAG: lytic transglycosylase domain-containing protein [Marinosulfonomonas sp.]|nr:lytic transglycosylase domain-containing protein [Marinosulfonomonas sp.]
MKPIILIVIGTVFLATAAAVGAQEKPAVRDFTFKRIGVPSPGSGRRITVQIDPEEQAEYLRVPAPVPVSIPTQPQTAPHKGDPFGWYWSVISPNLLAPNSRRLEDAVNHLRNNPDGQIVAAPRLQDLQNIVGQFGISILKATIGTRVSPAFVLAVIGIESSGRTDAVSSAGASGLMQLIPATAERFGVTDTTDPDQNIKGGVAYLDWLMKEFDNDAVMVLAAYNAGENAVRRNEGVPPYAETRAYIPKVLAAWNVAKGLCMTPPQLVSDGCVFAIKEARNGE